MFVTTPLILERPVHKKFENHPARADKFLRAMLNYRNTPDPTTGCSPARALFGRDIRDFIPVQRGRYRPCHIWSEAMKYRELALRHRWAQGRERWTEHTKRLPPLKVGDLVYIQNQSGNYPTRWDKSGVVIEVLQNDQYGIKVDGSGRVTLRNRKFLRRFTLSGLPGFLPNPAKSLSSTPPLGHTSPKNDVTQVPELPGPDISRQPPSPDTSRLPPPTRDTVTGTPARDYRAGGAPPTEGPASSPIQPLELPAIHVPAGLPHTSAEDSPTTPASSSTPDRSRPPPMADDYATPRQSGRIRRPPQKYGEWEYGDCE